MSMPTLFLVNLAIMIGVMVALWPISVLRKDPSYIDSVWPLGFIVMGVSTVLLTGQAVSSTSAVLLMTAIWGLRLGWHLFTRWRHEGPDKRYVVMRARAKFNPDLYILLYVFVLQAVLLWLVSLPIQHAVAEGPKPLGLIAMAGLALFALGFAFESVGDWQLSHFKANPANAGRVMDQGLWRYTRHPNYFGDACVFWGIWLVGIDDGTGWWTAIGPAFLTFTLIKWSGAALLEKGLRKSRPGYEDYIARTSGFLPWFPKRD